MATTRKELLDTAKAPEGRSALRRSCAPLALGVLVLAMTTAPVRADAVSDWYGVVQSVRESVPPASDPVVEQASPLVALAIYDAVAAVQGGYEPYIHQPPVDLDTSADAAAHAAAHAVLVRVLPASRAHFDSVYAKALQTISDDAARSRGIAVGKDVADRLLNARGLLRPTPATSYRPETSPGTFVPPQLPVREWIGGLRPFVLDNVDAFRTPGPPGITSEAYVQDYLEVASLGQNTSAVRTPEQTATALFWHSTSLGQVLPQFFSRPGRSLAANARLFALHATAEFDTAVVLVQEKYRYNLWRPVTALRNGDRDDNASTPRHQEWEPLLTTPSHPDYPCGHCTFGALTASILSADSGVAPKGGFSVTAGPTPSAKFASRHYRDFETLAEEISNSRVWGGVHFRTGANDGAALGRRVAEFILANAFRPVEPKEAQLAPRGNTN